MPSVISHETLQMTRPAGRLRDWVINAIELLGNTPEGKSLVRLQRDLAKPLIQELLPIGHFCFHKWGINSEVTVQPVLGNQNFDARIYGPTQETHGISYIEVTQATEGENEYRRREIFDRDGSVDPYGEVTKKGTKNTGISVKIKSELKKHSDIINQQIKFIENAVSRKKNKNYPSGTVLVIVFDDYIFKDEFGDIEMLDKTANTLSHVLNNVQWLSLVGYSGRTFTMHKTKHSTNPDTNL